MKKLMIAAAVAAMTAGAMADLCTPEGPVTTKVARVYQVQMNVYTTKGVTETTAGSAGICGPGTSGACLVKRGKDKTVFRGYLYTCADICNVEQYDACLCDVRRKAFFFDTYEDEESGETIRTYELQGLWRWNILNAIGVRNTDAETMWTLGMKYDADEDKWTDTGVKIAYLGTYGEGEAATDRIQTYHLVGAGYGVVKMGANNIPFFDELSGYFAGYATAPFDFAVKANTKGVNLTCACEPAKALACNDYNALDFKAYDTAAFGSWKIKFNANVSKTYLAGKWSPIAAVEKLFK